MNKFKVKEILTKFKFNKSKSNPLISVIIPIYNTEEYMEECIGSIVSQTLKDIEIICINDKTPDNSMDIIKKYAKEDKRFRIFENEEHFGPSTCRNKGLNAAKGKYIFFLDSDDKIEKDTLEKLYDFAEENDFDFVTFNMIRFDEEKEWTSALHGIAIENEKLVNLNILNHPKLVYDTTTCNKFVKRDFLNENNIRFEEGALYEDILYSIQIYCSDAKIGLLPSVKYFWRFRRGEKESVTQSIVNPKNIEDRAYIVQKEIGFLKESEYSDLLDELYVKTLNFDFLQFVNKLDVTDEEYFEILISNIEPIITNYPKETFEKINEINQKKYQYLLSNDLESIRSLLKNENN